MSDEKLEVCVKIISRAVRVYKAHINTLWILKTVGKHSLTFALLRANNTVVNGKTSKNAIIPKRFLSV